MICDRTRALGLRGRIAISHAFCLGMLEPARLEGLLDQLNLGIGVMTHAPQRPHAVSISSDAGPTGRAAFHWLGWRARCVGTARYRQVVEPGIPHRLQ